jgi:diaminopimelate epimerase
MVAFLKMHGAGNDFAVFDGRKVPLAFDARTAAAIADRRRGIGCDQVIVIEPADGAEAFMRIYNADGGEVESCGNAARCIARLLFDEKSARHARIETRGGMLACSDVGDGRVSVDMGVPNFDWREIPMAQAVDTESFALEVAGFDEPALAKVMAVSMGNPHCVLFVTDAIRAPVAELGPAIEHHPWFPARTNVEFAQVKSARVLQLRVWERGTGETLACGTGACAAVVAAAARGLTERRVDVALKGGTLTVEWRDDDHVLMTGPSVLAYRGDVDLDALVRA